MIQIKNFMEMLKTEYELLKEKVKLSNEYTENEKIVIIGDVEYILEMIAQTTKHIDLQQQAILKAYRDLEFRLYIRSNKQKVA